MTVTPYYLGVCVSGEGGGGGGYRAWCLDSENVWMGGGDRRYPYKFRYGVEECLK